MLNIVEQLGIRNALRNSLGPYRTRNNSRGSSPEETAAGQCRRLAGHGPVSITGTKPEPEVMVGSITFSQACAAPSVRQFLDSRLRGGSQLAWNGNFSPTTLNQTPKYNSSMARIWKEAFDSAKHGGMPDGLPDAFEPQRRHWTAPTLIPHEVVFVSVCSFTFRFDSKQ